MCNIYLHIHINAVCYTQVIIKYQYNKSDPTSCTIYTILKDTIYSA